MAYGTLTLADLQSVQLNGTVLRFGVANAFAAIDATLAAHNAIMGEMFGDLVERSTDEARRYGGVDTMSMEDGDEETVPRAQKVTGGSNVGFPLNAAWVGMQWTEMWFAKHSMDEMTAQVNAALDADVNRVTRDLKRSIFLSSNYTHTDHLARNIDIPVKRLVNADSAPIPVGPNAETFTASSHTHYLARVSTFAATDLDALISTVREHYGTADIKVYINNGQEAAVRAFTGFVAYVDPRLTQSTAATTVGRPLDLTNTNNRAIGLYNGAEIWVKPWVPANYLFCWNSIAAKPVVYRYDADYGDGLQLKYDRTGDPDYPFKARGFRRVFGMGIWQRINGAVLYVGGTSYSDPTIT